MKFISLFLYMTTSEFVNKANIVHNFKYDYSKVDYKNNYTNITIICPIHGEFIQRPSMHLRGCGCKKCAYEKLSNNQRYDSQKVIDMFNSKYNFKYDYSKVQYKNMQTPIIIGCPIHGEFSVKPYNHLNGVECSKCNYEKRKKQFIDKANIIHNFKYDYSQINFISTHYKINIICPIHGIFSQYAGAHLSGEGCPYCNKGIIKTQDTFINEASQIYNNKYDYSLVVYKNNYTKIMIICKKHGIFKVTPNNHLHGSECPICQKLSTMSILEKQIYNLLN